MRRSALVAGVIALVVGLSAPAAGASPPPTLSGQNVNDQVYFVGTGNTLDCHDNADGTVRIVYSFYAPANEATGPYPGLWSESGEIRLSAPQGSPGPRKILSLNSTFTFDSSAGQVSGSKRLAASPSNDAFVDCSEPSLGYIRAQTTYDATIVTAGGVFADRGRVPTNIEQDRAGVPTLDYEATYTSDLSSPEQRESALFGPRVPGGSFSTMSANAKRASPFTLYYAGTVRKLYAYVDGRGATSGSQTIRGVLYRNGPGNAPGALVAPTFQFTVPAYMTSRWVPLYLAPPTKLNPGVYWIGLQSDATNGVARFAWASKAGSRRFNVDGFADGPSDPFGTAALDDQQMSIFAAGSY